MRMLQLAARLLSCGNCEHDDRAKEAEERINCINTFSPATLQPVKLYLEHLAMCYVVFRESVQWWSWHILLYFGPRGHYLFECIQHCLTEMPK